MRSEPLANPEPVDVKVTLALCLLAGGLSIKRLMGYDYDHLILSHESWPEEPWRLVTCTLLHGGALHLVFNLLWTWSFGRILEPILGMVPMLLVLVLLAATSSAAEWTFNGPLIGLSGIGYGLFGILFALDRYAPRFRGVMDPRTARMFFAWFLFCIAATWLEWMPIANIAHGMGFVVGALLGWTLARWEQEKIRGVLAIAGLVLLVAAGSTLGRPYLNLSAYHASELFDDGVAALERGDPEAALACFSRVVEILPEEPAAHHNMGVALDQLGRTEEARQAFARSEEAERRWKAQQAERGADDGGPFAPFDLSIE